jgi:hypothetical protein
MSATVGIVRNQALANRPLHQTKHNAKRSFGRILCAPQNGRLYIVGVLIGGSAAFYLASHAGQGATFAISLGTLGVVWWSTTGMAYVAIRLGHVSQHKEWVFRSYVATFTFVTTRTPAELGILPSLGRDPFATLVWLSWSMPLFATEVILQGRKMMASQRCCLTPNWSRREIFPLGAGHRPCVSGH